MHHFIALFLLFSISILQAQNIQVFAGLGVNQYFDKGYDDGHYASEYKHGIAYGYGIGLFSDNQLLYGAGITMKLMRIDGGIDVMGGALGYGFSTIADANIKTFEIGLFPLRLHRPNGHLEVQIGAELSFTRTAKLNGKETNWQLDYDYSQMPPTIIYASHTMTLEGESDEYTSNMNLIACLRLGYAIEIGKDLQIIPRLYLGTSLSKRFTDKVDSEPKNWVGLMEIGIQKTLTSTPD